jgi:hypothetical protein
MIVRAHHMLAEAHIVQVQEEYIKEEQRNLKRELIRAEEEVKRIQSVPLVLGQFLEMVDANSGVVTSTTGKPALQLGVFFMRLSASCMLSDLLRSLHGVTTGELRRGQLEHMKSWNLHPSAHLLPSLSVPSMCKQRLNQRIFTRPEHVLPTRTTAPARICSCQVNKTI